MAKKIGRFLLAVFVVFVLAVSVFVYFASFAKTKILTEINTLATRW